MKVKELLAKPENWCQGHIAKDKNNIDTYPNSPKACKFCLVGAIEKCYPSEAFSVFKLVIAAFPLKDIPAFHSNIQIIASWNDHEERTHQEILDLTTRLDI